MVKDNDGRAARRAKIRQLSVAVGFCCFLVVSYELFQKLLSNSGKVRGNTLNHSHLKGRTDLDALHDVVSNEVNLILNAKVHLVDLLFSSRGLGNDLNSYNGVIGVFCKLDWNKHKQNPSSYPMFRYLKESSTECKNKIQYDLKDIVRLARNHDGSQDRHRNIPHIMEPTGFVFHESRCGSTLAANALAVSNPETTRVYSESPPPLLALKSCGLHMHGAEGICSIDQAVSLFRDVIYLMGRTDDAKERNLFFKIQSIGTKTIDVFQKAFPSTPWIFIYRDPVHVMMSHLEYGAQNANCVRQLSDIPDYKLEFLESVDRDVKSLTIEEKCALHLSLLCEAALQGLQSSQSTGMSVGYDNFIDKFVDYVLPNHFGMIVDDTMRERIVNVSKLYSKGRNGEASEFQHDSKRKEESASDEVKAAAQLFLMSSFNALESSAEDLLLKSMR